MENFIPLYNVLVGPNLDYAIQIIRPYLKKDIYHLERIQRGRWTVLVALIMKRDLTPLNYSPSKKEG